MNGLSRITDRQIIERFAENNLRCERLMLQNGVSVLISERGGRIFGPFLNGNASPSIYWMNEVFASREAFGDFLQSNDWNLGGERVWIAPEIQYHVRDRSKFWETNSCPLSVDPGSYRLQSAEHDSWQLSQDMMLEAFNVATGNKGLSMERMIRKVEDPLRNLNAYQDLTRNVIFAGYEHCMMLSEKVHDNIMSETWNLVQLNPGGTLFVPASRQPEMVDYLSPAEEFRSVHEGHVQLKITGCNQYKTGLKAAHVFGRVAYLNQMDDGRAYLLIRNYLNNPSSLYVEEPAHRPGCRGCSFHVYNDGGQFGRFGELECNGMTIGGETGRPGSVDLMTMWLYVGETNKIQDIMENLLDVRLTGAIAQETGNG